MLIVREFGRRPKYQNNLETMGMVAVQYPALSNVGEVPPLALQASGFTLAEWQDFLKLCLGFVVRAGHSLSFTHEWKRWLGTHTWQSWLVEAQQKEISSRPLQRRWPKARGSSRVPTMVKLLAGVLQLDRETDEDRINAILQAAWSESREDNRYQRRELPSRDLSTALREYAPGTEVVLNGRVYRSAGITLNWHIPASMDAVQEIQNIRYAWRCDHCGASGSWPSRNVHCTACGATIKQNRQHLREFLEPAGFAVDFYSVPHNDIDQTQFIPMETGWINAKGEWLPRPIRIWAVSA